MRVPNIEIWLLNDEVIQNHLKELEYKYLTAYTNINSIKAMIVDIKKDIRNENWDEKSLEIALDENNNQLASHIKAIKLHKKNIEFINNLK